MLSAPNATTPDRTSQSAAAGCLLPPTLMYSVVTDTINADTREEVFTSKIPRRRRRLLIFLAEEMGVLLRRHTLFFDDLRLSIRANQRPLPLLPQLLCAAHQPAKPALNTPIWPLKSRSIPRLRETILLIPSRSLLSSRSVLPLKTRRNDTDSFSKSGGLEILFSNERKHAISLPAQLDDGSRPNITYLLQYIIDNVMKDQRRELFVLEGNV